MEDFAPGLLQKQTASTKGHINLVAGLEPHTLTACGELLIYGLLIAAHMSDRQTERREQKTGKLPEPYQLIIT